jgi:HlyD family type I secretion membrane fusion protein
MTGEKPLEPLTTTSLVVREANDGMARIMPPTPRRKPFTFFQVAAGIAVVLLFVGSFGLWLSLAPISGAVVSPGVVQVASNRKIVQHLEGGIIDQILVRNGDQVLRGQPLVTLRAIERKAELAQLEGEQLETVATIGRLLAEQSGAPNVIIPPEFSARFNDPTAQSIVNGQQQILDSQRSLIAERLSVLEQRKAQHEEEISGLRAQIRAANLQLELLNEELSQLSVLDEKGLISRTRILARRQERAKVEGDLGQYQASVARLKKSIAETDLQIGEIRAAEIARVNKQLSEQRARLFDVSQRIIATRDVLDRLTIMSPIDGEVVNLQVHTTDGVIRPGQPILEIVPHDDDLIVRALVDPDDIEEVRTGMSADIRLTAVDRRYRLPLPGIVSGISPDRLTDPVSGRSYYEARVEFTPTGDEVDRQFLVAGMGADVFIRTSERSPLAYLMGPILRNVQFSLRER